MANRVKPTPASAMNETNVALAARNKTFLAKFPGNCARCGETFESGENVFYADNEIVADHGCDEASMPDDDINKHTKAPDVMPRGKTANDMCHKCFIIHASGQVECEW